MGLAADSIALLTQVSARRTARYGDALHFSGSDLPDPEVRRVPTRHGQVRCHVYSSPARPTGVPVTNSFSIKPPAYVHFHGGAFLMRFPEMDDFFARFIVAETGAAVVNVDYDVAPRYRYPVAQEQAHDVLAWLSVHAGEWGLDAERLAVGGFSAGGNLAASACLQARDRGTAKPRLQILGVPSLNVAEDVAIKASARPDSMIGSRLLNLVRKTYFKDASRRAEPYASPLLAETVDGLPPTVVITAERDSLRAEGDAFADRLRSAGLLVEHRVVPGRDHYFLDGDPADARALMETIAAHLRTSLVG